jgi:hypothetical protein
MEVYNALAIPALYSYMEVYNALAIPALYSYMEVYNALAIPAPLVVYGREIWTFRKNYKKY